MSKDVRPNDAKNIKKPKGAKPIGQVVIAFYFLPTLVMLMFCSADGHMSQRSKIGFLTSTAAISLSATALFLIIKKWQEDGKDDCRILLKSKDAAYKSSQSTAIPDQAALKAKEEEIAKLNAELSAVAEKYKKEQESKECMIKAITEAEEALQESQNGALERQLHAKMLQETIDTLKTQLANLQFELKTLLKVNAARQ
ncbi:MAG TPA: hypothetical protein VN457_07000 [Chlamydiales bacterium]|nr:hypothetical protein [Chlamydiales bacterium]